MRTSRGTFPASARGGENRRGARRGALLLLLLLGTASAVDAQAPQERLALVRANVLDPGQGKVIRNATLVVSGGKIESVSPGGPAPSGATVIDLDGRYLLPGLLDAHVHLTNVIPYRDVLRRILFSGVTTLRTAGTNGDDLGLRELARAGVLEAPEIVAAGYHVRPWAMENLYLDTPELADLYPKELRGAESLRRVVRVLAKRGVNVVKVHATERAGSAEQDPRAPAFTEEELRAVVEEASRFGLPVLAHAHGDEGARAAVRAGVRSVEHGTYLSRETMELMVRRGTFLVPSLTAMVDIATPGGAYDVPELQVRARHMLPRMRRSIAEAHRVGVRLVTATDMANPAGTGRLSHEVGEFVTLGLTPMQAIQSATTIAAELLGVADRTGRIAPGFEADLIVVEENPLTNIATLEDVLLVINNGRVVVRRLYR